MIIMIIFSVCVSVWEREGERGREGEREGGGERERERERERDGGTLFQETKLQGSCKSWEEKNLENCLYKMPGTIQDKISRRVLCRGILYIYIYSGRP